MNVFRPRAAAGFTMIEMMIVVAIVGMLVAIAGPLYDRYQAKTRQAEAKLVLGAIFAAEKGFHSEYAAYISAFDALHYAPEATRRFYAVGWSAAMTGTVTGYSGVYTNPTFTRINTPPDFGCDAAVAVPTLPAPTGSDAQAFTVGASGEVRLGRGCDIWTMDQDKAFQNSNLGI